MLLDFLKQKGTQESKLKINHHFVFIEVPFEIVVPEVMKWLENPSWWPKKCRSVI